MHTHSHSHAHADAAVPAGKTVRIVLAAIVVPILLATLFGVIWLWPKNESALGTIPMLAKGVSESRGTVVSLDVSSCIDPSLPDTDQLKDAVCVKVTDGKQVGTSVPVHVRPEVRAELKVGAKFRMLYTPDAVSSGTAYIYWDMDRATPIVTLLAIYLILVIAVARWRGAAAIVGLAASCLVLVGFIIPALLGGANPLLVVTVGAGAMMFASVYLAHGISVRTTTALLGTFAGLALTVGLAIFSTWWAQLTGAGDETAVLIHGSLPRVSLSLLLTGGIVVAGLGVLNDVTITQSSAVWELHGADPNMPRRKLFTRAMRIGRDHIASTVYTLAFAYAGTALPVLMLAMMVDRPLYDTMLSNDIAEEIVRTLVASIGLILAIPATTAVGTMLVKLAPGRISAGNTDAKKTRETTCETGGEIGHTQWAPQEKSGQNTDGGHKNGDSGKS